jgi:hypothetical protein
MLNIKILELDKTRSEIILEKQEDKYIEKDELFLYKLFMKKS